VTRQEYKELRVAYNEAVNSVGKIGRMLMIAAGEFAKEDRANTSLDELQGEAKLNDDPK